MKRAFSFLLLILLISFAGFLQFKYDSYTNYFAEKKLLLSLPSGNALKILSFGYNDLVADMIYIWSIQFLANPQVSNRYDYIEYIYNIITDLNPQFYEAYIIGSSIMAMEAHDAEMSIRLLQKGSKNMENEWIFDFESGENAAKFLKDYKRAENYFRRASQKPGAHRLAKFKRAHMLYMNNQLKESYNLWKDIYRDYPTHLEKFSAFKHLYQIKFEMDKKRLEQMLNQFKAKMGKYPKTLEGLIEAGLIKNIPLDYRGEDYLYNPKTGKIKAKHIAKWKKLSF